MSSATGLEPESGLESVGGNAAARCNKVDTAATVRAQIVHVRSHGRTKRRADAGADASAGAGSAVTCPATNDPDA